MVKEKKEDGFVFMFDKSIDKRIDLNFLIERLELLEGQYKTVEDNLKPEFNQFNYLFMTWGV